MTAKGTAAALIGSWLLLSAAGKAQVSARVAGTPNAQHVTNFGYRRNGPTRFKNTLVSGFVKRVLRLTAPLLSRLGSVIERSNQFRSGVPPLP